MFETLVSKLRHNYYSIFKIFSFSIAIALVMWFMPRSGKFQYEYLIGKPWQHASLYAPFDFAIYKTENQL